MSADETEPLKRRASDVTLPWQVRAVTTLGVTSVIALGLIWWITQTLNPKVEHIREMMLTHVVDQTVVRGQNEAIIRILRASCVNESASREDRDRCFQ